MIAYVKGRIEEYGEDYVIIDNNGMGYLVSMPLCEIEKLKKTDGEVKINTYHYIREDNMGLYGFLDKEALNIFRMLIGVSGVGPKVGLSIMSSIEPSSIVLAIISNDEKTLCKASGVGKKLAQRIILELKDKFKDYDFKTSNSIDIESIDESFEAIGALMALGYTKGEAASAVKGIDSKDIGVEETVKRALKVLMRG